MHGRVRSLGHPFSALVTRETCWGRTEGKISCVERFNGGMKNERPVGYRS